MHSGTKLRMHSDVKTDFWAGACTAPVGWFHIFHVQSWNSFCMCLCVSDVTNGRALVISGLDLWEWSEKRSLSLHMCERMNVCVELPLHPSLTQGGEETTRSPESRGQVRAYSTPAHPPPPLCFLLPRSSLHQTRDESRGWCEGGGTSLQKSWRVKKREFKDSMKRNCC